jgi:hypothetical protein
MKNLNDIIYVKTENPDDTGTIMLALGIEGEVVYILTTYVWFYDLIKNNIIEENINSTNAHVLIDIKKDDTILETVECTEELSAILRSSPDIIEIVRSPLPPAESLGVVRWISKGWHYDSEYNITPPTWWKQPIPVNQNLTEQQKEAARKLGYNV